MQSVEWAYYGNDSTYTNRLANYGTKFAADNWMHKMMGIQLGLTRIWKMQSFRKELTETGYWILTVHALGYQDYVVEFQATAEEIIAKPAGDADSTPLENIIAEAKAPNQADYTPESWAAAKDSIANELEECEEMLANIKNQTTCWRRRADRTFKRSSQHACKGSGSNRNTGTADCNTSPGAADRNTDPCTANCSTYTANCNSGTDCSTGQRNYSNCKSFHNLHQRKNLYNHYGCKK